MSSIDQVKARVKAERGKIRASIDAIVGSRASLAVLAALAVAFGAHLWFAPERLPLLGAFSLAQFGLGPDVDFGLAGEAARDAAAAAKDQGATEAAKSFLAERPMLVTIINAAAFGASVVLMLWTLAIQAGRRRRQG